MNKKNPGRGSLGGRRPGGARISLVGVALAVARAVLPVKRVLSSRNTRRIAAAALVALAGSAALAAYALFSSVPGRIQVAPVSVVVHSAAALPAEVQALEAGTAPLLFDRDTRSAHVAFADQRIDATLDRPTEIRAIKVYGPAPYELTVAALQGDTWTPIPGLSRLKLGSLDQSWNEFAVSQPVTTQTLRFELTPVAGAKGKTAAATGLAELEIWGTGDHALVSGTALVDAMQAGDAAGGQPVQARAYAATPESGVIGKDGQTFHVTLDRPAARFKRAWLSYEAYGLAHWVSPVRRINGLAVQGGSFTFAGSEWTPLVEPIHPDWLVEGGNRIEFTLPPDANGTYSVRNVRIVGELDDGANFIARATTTVAGIESDTPALIDGDLASEWSPYADPRSKTGKPELTLYFDRTTQLDSLSIRLANALAGTLSVDLLVGGQWQTAGLPTINGSKLSVGWNVLSGFAPVPADALRIRFLNGTGSSGEIRELSASGSGVNGPRTPDILVGYPDAGQFYGRQAYLRGYLSVPDNGSGPAVVSIGERTLPASDGSFGVVVSKDEVGYANQADGEAWQVRIDAAYPDGQKLSRIVRLTQQYDAARAQGVLPSVVNPGFSAVVVGGDASLDIDPDAVDKPMDIKITPLKEHQLPPLDPGMTNVTPGPLRGYRFTPHGAKFKKHIKVTLPYDPSLIPQGLNEQDVKTYYFDTELNRWVVLDRYRVDNGKRKVTSLTNHFTDMINATLTVPDHPETTSYNATQMKDIKAADPGAVNGQTMMIVSGRSVFDGLGRTVAQYYPVVEPLGQAGTFNPANGEAYHTKTEFDVLDRTVKTTLPDDTVTTMAYGFGRDRDGRNQFKTTVTDANGNSKESYRDVRELITAVKETNKGEALWTSYAYDPLKQIVQVKDVKGVLTKVEYDVLGRRTVIDNPDTGRTQTVYDPASNVVQKITANLAAARKAISYDYDFNRLKAIRYPVNAANDVAYEYGDASLLGNGSNQVGRLVKVVDASGNQELHYGRLGETVKEIRTIASRTQGASKNSPEVYTTRYRYDTFGRLLELVLPDSETVTYVYDAGGSLTSFAGDKQGTHVSYLNLVHYDKFEQRTRLVLGNGIETKYAYDPASRRLDTLTSAGVRAGTFQNLHYGYDKVGNILSLANQVDVPPPTTFGGPNKQQFGYDDLYRLTTAKGEYKSAPDRVRNYTLDLVYDTNHNILAKKQSDVVTVAGGSAITQKGTSYDWHYAYEGAQPHAPTHIGNRSFSYDLNGNQTGWQSDVNGTRRFILWDEENRIAEIDDNGERNHYVYDAKGERAIKETKQGETVYVNQYYVVRNRSVVSKHLYAGTGRVVSHLVMGTVPGGHKTPGNEQRGAPGNGHGSDKTPTPPETGNGNSGNVATGNNGQDQDQGNNGLHLGQLKNGKENPGQGRERRSDAANAHAQDVDKNPTLTGEQPGQGSENRSEQATAVAKNARTSPLVITEGDASIELGGDTSEGESVEGVTATTSTPTVNGQSEFIWYYHPDHLGSTGFVTDQNGELYEHVEYFPFGETWVQEHSNTQRTPYLYTGKELDEETGLYYYGARYYDPRTSVWVSADPILAKYLSGDINGGVYNSSNLSAYVYSYLSPIVLLDQDGNAPSAKEAAQMATHVYGDSTASLTGGWQVASASTTRSLGLQVRDNSTGFNSQLYIRGDNEYFYATQGTNPTSGKDWRNNKQQLSGTSAQYRQSVQNAKALSRILGAGADLSYGGHSLGGGLAAANAMATGRDAKTFNAAAVSDATKRALGLGKPGQIDAFVVRGEALDVAQRLIGMTADGTRHSLEPATPYAPSIPWTRVDDFIRAGQSGYNHTMGAVLDALP